MADDGAATPENRPRTGHETDDSSGAGSLLDATAAGGQTLDFGSGSPLNPDPKDEHPGGIAAPARQGGAQRRHLRHRSAGGFLLHDSFSGDRHRAYRHSAGDAADTRATASPAPRIPGSSRPNGSRNSRLAVPLDASPRLGTISPRSSQARSSGGSHHDATDAGPLPSPLPTSAGLDADSAQIVRMALNLSESRRIALQRNASRGTPPRLAPLPDGSAGSTLRQHLQQQRRSSRNMSPKPNASSSSVIPHTVRLDSPLLPDLESGADGQYRYHFSSSTLSRAQKAKEHLELMTEYWRLLETLPPLKPGFERQLSASPPGSPVGNRANRFGSQRSATHDLGRQYNPLQFIRNRKVRARERKAVDGERQGFGDVESVRLWVDEVCKQSCPDEDSFVMPAFPGADGSESQTSPDAHASRAAARARRPRVDWLIAPCEMLADAYWLEQDHHKHLIEDRQWRKIFPQAPADISRPMSREPESPINIVPPFSLQADSPTELKTFGINKAEVEASSARDRARQKLQNIRTFPHRHSGPLSGHHHHDFMRLKKDSSSDLSNSEIEGKKESKRRMRRGRRETITSNANDLLEKQMLEMVAQEARERELSGAVVDGDQIASPPVMSPDRIPFSPRSSAPHSRKGSATDASDSDRRDVPGKTQLTSPPADRHSRQSLDVADESPRPSIENVVSLPTSPRRASKDSSAEPRSFSAALSPARSRAASPIRNSLSKIKHIIRDRNDSVDMDDDGDRQSSAQGHILLPEKENPPTKRESSPKKSVSEQAPEIGKAQRSSGNLRRRPDDQAAGLRGIFKGSRLDTVIRDGASKLGDILWRKDGSGEPASGVESTDESESEKIRGRHRSLSQGWSRRTQHGRQPSKHLLDSMPEFNHAAGIHHARSVGYSHREAMPPLSVNQSRRSSRFEMLKPPRLDVRGLSSTASSPGGRKARPCDSDVSEPESWQGSVAEVARGRRLNEVLGTTEANEPGPRPSRHWSIADRGYSTEQTRLSRREIARTRVLILSSGIKALEISRRANELHRPFASGSTAVHGGPSGTACGGIGWADIARLSPEDKRQQLLEMSVPYRELYLLAGRTLGSAVRASGQQRQALAERFATTTAPGLERRINEVRALLAELSERTRAAADESDETSRHLALDQPLQVKQVVDAIDKMLRRRRRRLRWLRRALWLVVEWLLIGFMWFVWFVVMMVRVVLGVGRGAGGGVRWLLWL